MKTHTQQKIPSFLVAGKQRQPQDTLINISVNTHRSLNQSGAEGQAEEPRCACGRQWPEEELKEELKVEEVKKQVKARSPSLDEEQEKEALHNRQMVREPKDREHEDRDLEVYRDPLLVLDYKTLKSYRREMLKFVDHGYHQPHLIDKVLRALMCEHHTLGKVFDAHGHPRHVQLVRGHERLRYLQGILRPVLKGKFQVLDLHLRVESGKLIGVNSAYKEGLAPNDFHRLLVLFECRTLLTYLRVGSDWFTGPGTKRSLDLESTAFCLMPFFGRFGPRAATTNGTPQGKHALSMAQVYHTFSDLDPDIKYSFLPWMHLFVDEQPSDRRVLFLLDLPPKLTDVMAETIEQTIKMSYGPELNGNSSLKYTMYVLTTQGPFDARPLKRWAEVVPRIEENNGLLDESDRSFYIAPRLAFPGDDEGDEGDSDSDSLQSILCGALLQGREIGDRMPPGMQVVREAKRQGKSKLAVGSAFFANYK